MEKIMLWLVWRLPKTLVMWCGMRIGAHATTGEYGSTIVPDLTFMDAMKRWEQYDGRPDDSLFSLEEELETLLKKHGYKWYAQGFDHVDKKRDIAYDMSPEA